MLRWVERVALVCSVLWVAVFIAAWALSLFVDAGFSRGDKWTESGTGSPHIRGRSVWVHQTRHGVELLACSYELPADWNPRVLVGIIDSVWWGRRGEGESAKNAMWLSWSTRDGYTVAWPGSAPATFKGWTFSATVPYWAFVVGGLAAMIPLLVRRRCRLARERAGRCRGCGYSRAGIAAAAACPECGRLA